MPRDRQGRVGSNQDRLRNGERNETGVPGSVCSAEVGSEFPGIRRLSPYFLSLRAALAVLPRSEMLIDKCGHSFAELTAKCLTQCRNS